MHVLPWTAALVLTLVAAAPQRPPSGVLHPNAAHSPCANPAPLLGEESEAAGYIVVFREGTKVRKTIAHLRHTYRFKPEHVFKGTPPGFSAELSDAALAGIRCAPEVEYVEHNAVVTPG